MSSVDPRVEDVKNILYLDGNGDDQLLDSYVKAANAFVHNAVGDDVSGFYQDSQVKALVDLAVKSLAATYYQNRLALSDVQTHPVDLTVNAVIGQLRGMYNSLEGDPNATAD